MADVRNDLAVFQEFREALGTRDPKTIATYLTTMHDFVTWLAAQPGGTPFHLGLVTETAVRGYNDELYQLFCKWYPGMVEPSVSIDTNEASVLSSSI